MKTINKIFLIAFILTLYGCSYVQEVSTFQDLREAKDNGNLQIVTRDTTVYYADNFTYSDSSININGISKKSNLEIEFNGPLYFKDIAYVQSSGSSFMGGLLFLGANALIIGNGVSVLGSSGINAAVKIVYPTYGGGGGSCPYIYSWDGNNYKLEGEAFGTALGKALETQTFVVLKDLKSSRNRLKLKLSNERPETHFFNNIKLVAVETGNDETVYADNHNSLCIVKKHKKILKAFDRNNVEITDLLINDDNHYWKSDLSSATTEANFEDKIIVELKNIDQVDSISLMVSALNSEISSVVFSYLQKTLGDEFANFTKAAETDPDIIDILKKTLNRSALKIDIWDGTNWKYADLIYPEANTIKFKKLVRLPVIETNNCIMKIRLRCLSDVWKIDALNFDDSPTDKSILVQPQLLFYKSDAQSDSSSILNKDDNYVKLLPGQSINLEYENVSAPTDKKITYALNVGGYLYEWLIDNSTIPGDGIKNLSTSTPKLLLVKEMLKNFDAILPLIYSDWKEIKNKFAANEIH